MWMDRITGRKRKEMSRKYSKECKGCMQIFNNKGSRRCPFCGSDSWNWILERGRTLRFVVPGNQESRTGNPVPYLRMTQNELTMIHVDDRRLKSNAQRKKKAMIRRYLDWKRYVAQCCYYESELDGVSATSREIGEFLRQKGKMRVDCMVYFANKKHGDVGNIRKAVEDSLFENDKYVVGSVDYDYDSERPRTEVTVRERG